MASSADPLFIMANAHRDNLPWSTNPHLAARFEPPFTADNTARFAARCIFDAQPEVSPLWSLSDGSERGAVMLEAALRLIAVIRCDLAVRSEAYSESLMVRLGRPWVAFVQGRDYSGRARQKLRKKVCSVYDAQRFLRESMTVVRCGVMAPAGSSIPALLYDFPERRSRVPKRETVAGALLLVKSGRAPALPVREMATDASLEAWCKSLAAARDGMPEITLPESIEKVDPTVRTTLMQLVREGRVL